jgi:putative inorganic carbon (hco3(-)) transporter
MKAASPCLGEFSSSLNLSASAFAEGSARVVLVPLRALLALPVSLFLFALTAMLFRPPETDLLPVDRFAFALLAFAVGLRFFIHRQSVCFPKSLLVPMLGLSALALSSALSDATNATLWSVLAARVFVPCGMFVAVQLTFHEEQSLRWLERFLLVVFAYLSLTAVASLLGARALIFPRFLLDPNLGIHTDRARGPFLEAAANGLSLNLLGLLALDLFRRRRFNGWWAAFLLATLPLAIVATKTRAVWVSFAVSMVWMTVRSHDQRLQRAIIALIVVGCMGVLGAFCLGDCGQSLADRFQEEGTVEFRLAAYQAGWEMFLQSPLTGWGSSQIQVELADQIRDFRGEQFAVHNTYIQMLIEQGLVGFLLYAWLMIGMYRLRRFDPGTRGDLAASIHELWPVLLAVYLVNGTFAVMNYQFVNSLLFTFAGVLAGTRRSAVARS